MSHDLTNENTSNGGTINYNDEISTIGTANETNKIGMYICSKNGVKNVDFTIDTDELKNDYFLDSEKSINMIRWAELNNIYTTVGAYGGVSCIMLTKLYYVIGTNKGSVLIFNTNQFLQAILIPKLSNDFSEGYLKSPVKNLTTSSDGTHLCASLKTNDILIWDLNLNTNEMGNDNKSISVPLTAILHITNHKNFEINGLGFLGERHTAIIVSDNSGSLYYHSGYRNHLWNLMYTTKKVLTVKNEERLLNSKVPIFSDNYLQKLHWVAILTTKTFKVISTLPHLNIIYVENIIDSIAPTSYMNNCISWSKRGSKLAFSIENKLGVYYLSNDPVHARIESNFTITQKCLQHMDESILSLYWITENLIGILTISHQFIILSCDENINLILKLDLLPYNIPIPPNKHFGIIDNHVYIFGKYSFMRGKFMTWSDIILNPVQKGDYITALKFIEYFLKPTSNLNEIIQLKSLPIERYEQFKRPFHNLSLAAMRFLLKQKKADYDKIYELLVLILRNLNRFPDSDTKQILENSLIEKSFELLNGDNPEIFFEVLVNVISEGYIKKLPPTVFKAILSHYANLERIELMEILIVTLDPQTLDIDFAVKLCKEHRLYNVLIYLWNVVFADFITPFVSFIAQITKTKIVNNLFEGMGEASFIGVYDLLSSIYCNSSSPSLVHELEPNIISNAKLKINYVFFNGTLVTWPYHSGNKFHTCTEAEEEPVYPYFSVLLKHNSQNLLKIIDKMFEEDALLNDDILREDSKNHKMWVNRQYIMDMLVDILNTASYQEYYRFLVIFLAKNITKYPQYIKFSNNILQNIIDKIFTIDVEKNDDLELSLEYLLLVYEPTKLDDFVHELEIRQFFKVLFRLYLKLNRYSNLLRLVFSTANPEEEFEINISNLLGLIFNNTKSDPLEKPIITNFIIEHFEKILNESDIDNIVKIINNYNPEIHQAILTISSEDYQLRYLEKLFNFKSTDTLPLCTLKKRYVNLSCKYKKGVQLDCWLKSVDLTNVDISAIIKNLKINNEYKSLAMIHKSVGDNEEAIDYTVIAINALFEESTFEEKQLHEYIEFATGTATLAKRGLKEACWSKIITCLFSIYTKNSLTETQMIVCGNILKNLFIKLALGQEPNGEEHLESFCSVLTNVLENQDVLMSKSHVMRKLLQNVFTAFYLEEQYSSLIFKILDANASGLLITYGDKLIEGWSCDVIHCEVCGKNIWGNGISDIIYYIWEQKRRDNNVEIGKNYDDLNLVIFSCHHGFHSKCLKNLGQNNEKYYCLSCNDDNKKIDSSFL
ncbi:hypothetical protein TPHA_0F00720 [Tetrapisispora phaffii CBS 4417]|uniref:Vacuolar protein sorting-associated protein 8 central domain-containing protein n=1 Tax=Tetrapisispora phaffii (strain ATCC 24235 / CBS 4417 / NBRC 1672 / NRRL Y-8282 / UCD 70-5) TaxID=1071381 RepID=G8BUX6_TETPH|nr:hypothetical protein TPHA_0F00720 [Tetrapisispora phaffii CBS 4417]CCE63558.1 hypothetical protein TPHA_0F00720 [Tetrapisispora phaffii CBS 4417]